VKITLSEYAAYGWEDLYDYKVIYHGNGNTGGKVPVDSTTYYSNSTVEAKPVVLGNIGGLVRNGYAFAGWDTAPDDSGTTYQAGDVITPEAYSTSDINLYVKWIPTYKVTYHPNNLYSNGKPAPVPVDDNRYTSSDFVKIRNMDVLNYVDAAGNEKVFYGWNTKPDGTGAYYMPSDVITVSQDITLYLIAVNDSQNKCNLIYP